MTDQIFPSKPGWKALLAACVTDPMQLAERFGVNPDRLAAAIRRFPMRINPYYFSLIRWPGDAIWRQAVPDPAELTDAAGTADPLCEEEQSPVPGLIHRYPDRVVLLAADQCAMFCRFCMSRKRG